MVLEFHEAGDRFWFSSNQSWFLLCLKPAVSLAAGDVASRRVIHLSSTKALGVRSNSFRSLSMASLKDCDVWGHGAYHNHISDEKCLPRCA